MKHNQNIGAGRVTFKTGGGSFRRILTGALVFSVPVSSVIVGVGFYEPSSETSPGEQTSTFLPSDTDAYFSFNLKPGLSQSTGFGHFIGLFEDAIIEEVEDRLGSTLADILRGIDDVTELVGPELAASRGQ